jgi:Electron transfer DM13
MMIISFDHKNYCQEQTTMKRNAWILLGSTSLLIATFNPQVYGQIRINSSVANLEPMVITQARSTNIIMSGTFKAGEKPATGKATIIREGGHSFLQLDSAFTTSNQGPDLHVLLDPTNNPPKNYQGAMENRVINLGKLKSFSGMQRYPIPDSVNLANYKSVVIWCRTANATFAYAPLSGK